MKHIYKKLVSFLTTLVFGACLNAMAEVDPNFHIYICFGQSNMEGNATVPDAEKVGVSDRFKVLYSANDCSNGDRKLGQWYTATPPLARCFHWNNSGFGPIDYFGRTLVDSLDSKIRIGVIVVAVGGADIQLFEEDGYESYLSSAASWLQNYAAQYGNNCYKRIIDMAKIAQQEGVIKGILVHQGETNNMQQTWPSRLKKIYESMLSDLNLKGSEVPLLVGETRRDGSCSGHNSVIATVPNVIPNSYVISSEGLEGNPNDTFHFTVAGYTEFGKRYAAQMLKLLGNNPVQSAGLSLSTSISAESEPGEVEISVALENENITKVEIYADDNLLSTGTSYTWEDVTEGTHSIYAVGYDNSGKTYTTSKTEISIFAPQTPYNGTPASIPGKIEAEEFDFGGEGNAYHDNDTQNRNGGTRDEGVDMSNTAIGYSQKGEWIEYTVNVEQDGDYVVESRVASGADGSAFTLYLDNNFIIPGEDGTPNGFVEVPNTGDWSTYTTVRTKLNKLTKGTHVLKVEITGDWVDLDYMDFQLEEPSKIETVAADNDVLNGEYAVYDVLGIRMDNVIAADGKLDLPNGMYIIKNLQTNKVSKVLVSNR